MMLAISILGGLAFFLFGILTMGESVSSLSAGAASRLLRRTGSSAFPYFIVGLSVTAVMQSSSAVIVLSAALVSIGALDLKSAAGVMLGANVGTAATAQILRLAGGGAALTPSVLAALLAALGTAAMLFTKHKALGRAVAGLGVLFMGLSLLSSAATGSDYLQRILSSEMASLQYHPLASALLGGALSALFQSSSAAVGLMQALCGADGIPLRVVFPMLMGVNVAAAGVTSILCRAYSGEAAAVGRLTFLVNATAMGVLLAAFCILSPSDIGGFWGAMLRSGDIANLHGAVKLAASLVFLPFTDRLAECSRRRISRGEVRAP